MKDANGRELPDSRHLMLRNGVYYINMRWEGKRIFRSTKMTALSRARKYRSKFVRALMDDRIDALDKSRVQKERGATIGQVIEMYESEARAIGEPGKSTVRQNISTLRRIVRVARKVREPDKQPVSILDRDLVRAYANAVIPEEKAGDSEVVAARRRSVRSDLRQARSVFKRSMRGLYEPLNLPDTLQGFLDYMVCVDPPVNRDEYTTDERAILRAVKGEKGEFGSALRERDDKDVYVVWLLAFHLGMRANEIAKARWAWIVDGEMEIRERPDEGFDPKGYSGWVPIHDQVMAELVKNKRPDDPYIVPGGSYTARYNSVTRELATWMRAQGWRRNHCAHELRAYRGQRWRDEYGTEVMRDWLRHASEQTGMKHYTTNHNRQHAPLAD